jgi:hypothetical protein
VPEIQSYTMNFGPQHPAAHGVLRLVLEMEGEVIYRADPHVGLLHRATEKLAESKPYNQSIGYMDRLDYVSMMCNEHAYVRAIELLTAAEVPVRAQYIRTMFDEITRILNHLMWLGAHGLDIGAMTVFLYAFREREDLMDCYEAVSGTRMHATYYRPGGVYRDLPHEMPKYQSSQFRSRKEIDRLNEARSGSLLDFIDDFAKRFPGCVDTYETLLTDNRIWKQRTVGIGVVSPERALQLGFSGPLLRGSGVRAEHIGVVGNYPTPHGRYQRLCVNSQIPAHERLRSNSDSCPDNIWGFPGYAAREAWRDLTGGREAWLPCGSTGCEYRHVMEFDVGVLESVVGRALEAEQVALGEWSAEQVFAGDGQGLGVFRLMGSARVGDEPRAWSVILKVLPDERTAAWSLPMREPLAYVLAVLANIDPPAAQRVSEYLDARLAITADSG